MEHCAFEKIEPDHDYLPGTTVYYSCGLRVSIVRGLDSIRVRPRLNQDINHLCKQIDGKHPDLSAWFDLVNDAIVRYLESYGGPRTIIVPTNAPKDEEIEKCIIDRFAKIGYTLNKKMKKDCGDCDENLHLMFFKHSTAEEVEQPYDHY
jgi:hypothetical protein